MSTQRFNTGNPIGSNSPLDRSDNTRNLDQAVNAPQDTFQDRLGKSRLTWAGMESGFGAGQVSREQRFRTFIASSGYQFAGDYAAGIEITQYNQILRDENGEFWRVSGQVDLPYVTTGAGIPEDDALVPAGDAVLRQDLANLDKGAAMVARGVVAVDSIAGLLALPEGQRKEGLRYEVKGYHAGINLGGGSLIWDGDSLDMGNGFNRFTVPGVLAGCFKRIGITRACAITEAGAVPGGDAVDAVSRISSAIPLYPDELPRAIFIDPFVFTIDETFPNFIQFLQVEGIHGRSTLKYIGAENAVAVGMRNSAGIASAISFCSIRNLVIDMNFVPGAIGLQCAYAVNSTDVDHIRIVNVGPGGVGLDVTQTWYANFGDIQINNPNTVEQRGGAGLRIRSDAVGGGSSQVNGITFQKVQIKGFDDGILYDTTYAALYTISIDAVIERCGAAIRHVGYNGVIEAKHRVHFESNDSNVVWGTPDDIAVSGGTISFDGYASGGDWRFSHGAHKVEVRAIPLASVFITAGARVAWYGEATDNSGSMYPGTSVPTVRFVENIISPGVTPSAQNYAGTQDRYGKHLTAYYDKAVGDQVVDMKVFGRTIINRRHLRLDLLMVRDADGQRRTWSGYAVLRTTGTWMLVQDSGSEYDATFTLTLGAGTGILTHSGTLSGRVSVLITPM